MKTWLTMLLVWGCWLPLAAQESGATRAAERIAQAFGQLTGGGQAIDMLKRQADLEVLKGTRLAALGLHEQAGLNYARADQLRGLAYKHERDRVEKQLEEAARAPSPQAVYLATGALLYVLDSLAQGQGDYATQSQIAERRLALAQEKQDGEAEAQALEAWGRAQLNAGDLTRARRCAQASLAIRSDRLKRQSLYRPVNLLADIAYQDSDWDQARAGYREVIALSLPGALPPLYDLSQATPEQLRNQATERQLQVQSGLYARVALGVIAQDLGNYREAAQEYARARSDLGSLRVAGAPDQDKALAELLVRGLEALLVVRGAYLLEVEGDLEGATKAYKDGIQLTSEVTGGAFPLVGAYLSLARLEVEQLHYEAAEAPLQTAMAHYQRHHQASNIAQVLSQTSLLRRRQGRPLEAVELARQGLELAQAIGERGLTARMLWTLGLAEGDLGGPALAQSEGHLRLAAESFRQLGIRASLAYTLDDLGKTLERLQRDSEALQVYREAVDLVELLGSGVSGEVRLFHGSAANRELYERLIRLQIKLGQPGEAMRYLERLKGKSLVDALAGTWVKSQDPAIQALLDAVRSTAQRLRKAYTAAVAAPELDRSPLAGLEGDYRQAVQRLQRASPAYSGLVAVGQTDLAALRQRLPRGVLLLEYFESENNLFIFSLTADHQARLFTTSLGRERLQELVVQLLRAVLNQQESSASRDLYQFLLAPVESEINQAEVVLIVAGGQLGRLSFETLADARGTLLIERKPVVYLSQANMVEPVLAVRPGPARRSSLLALGNPDGSLPDAGKEVSDLGRLFGSPELYLGKQASLAHLTHPLVSPTYLHLATHGMLNGRDPKESYLVLAGEPNQLHVRDILEERFHLALEGTRLVTLSACNSDLGGLDPSAVYGSLSRAFLKAGAPSVVATLWSVDDLATRVFMGLFYTQLTRGRSRAEALRQAQLQMRRQPGYSNAFYWAPFVLMGDWR